jgi:hypothetical protein
VTFEPAKPLRRREVTKGIELPTTAHRAVGGKRFVPLVPRRDGPIGVSLPQWTHRPSRALSCAGLFFCRHQKFTLRIVDAPGWRDYRIAGTNMPTIDECRRKAEECLRWADEAANDAQRETLLEIARLWTQMELSSAEPNGVDGLLKSQGFQRRQSRSLGRRERRRACTGSQAS